jgi:hypothetical protein
LKHWWILSGDAAELIPRINRLPRYIVCGYAGERPIFEFACREIRPSAGCSVFPFADDYSFGVLQSEICRTWFTAKHMPGRPQFGQTPNHVFESFPWPQSPAAAAVQGVVKAARALRARRRMLMEEGSLSLRELYDRVVPMGKKPFRAAQDELDGAVRAAYGMDRNADTLRVLLELNLQIASREEAGMKTQGPGVPANLLPDKEVAGFSGLDGMEIQPLEA